MALNTINQAKPHSENVRLTYYMQECVSTIVFLAKIKYNIHSIQVYRVLEYNFILLGYLGGLAYGKQLHDCVILLRRDVFRHKVSLAHSTFY